MELIATSDRDFANGAWVLVSKSGKIVIYVSSNLATKLILIANSFTLQA